MGVALPLKNLQKCEHFSHNWQICVFGKNGRNSPARAVRRGPKLLANYYLLHMRYVQQ